MIKYFKHLLDRVAKDLCIIDVKFTGHEQGLFLKLTGQVQATGLSTVFALHNTCTETNAD